MSDSLNKAELNHFLAQQALKSQKKHLNHKFTRWFKALLIPLIFLAACE
ncbi:ABC transporter permease, partial [Acinetobacter baumannii]|nr:ABC transporter permease [Acinetobacter baumannii]